MKRASVLLFTVCLTFGTACGGEEDAPGTAPSLDGGGGQDGQGTTPGLDGGGGQDAQGTDLDGGQMGTLAVTIIAPSTAVAGEPVAVEASSPGTGATFSWAFGDGGRAGAAKVAHVFGEPGSYEIVVHAADAAGQRGQAKHVIQVEAGAAPAGQADLEVRVDGIDGAPLAGVQVTSALGTAVTASDGMAVLAVPRGIRTSLRLEREGFADHMRSVVVDPTVTSSPYRATMVTRGAPQVLSSVEAGASVTGPDGSTLTLPPAALVDETGAPVTGSVELTITPLDVVTTPFAFPSGIDAYRSDASAASLATYGVGEYVFTQDGKRLNLASDARATIDIPIYAQHHLDGSAVEVGQTTPLWSLDERTGVWIEEGMGTVVSADTPSGLALRGSVSHFSWWNCDTVFEPLTVRVKCCVDTDGDLECDSDVSCFVRGTPDCREASCPPSIASTPATTVLPVQGQDLRIPSGIPLAFDGLAVTNGTSVTGTFKRIPASPDEASPITVVLQPSKEEPADTVPIAPGHDAVYSIGLGAGHTYKFTVDKPTWVLVEPEASDPILARAQVVDVQEIGGATSASFLTAAGTHYLRVWASFPGSYRVRLLDQTQAFVPTSLSPGPQTVLTGQTPIALTMSDTVLASSVAGGVDAVWRGQALLTNENTAAGNVATLVPAEPWPAGRNVLVGVNTIAKASDGTAAPGRLRAAYRVAPTTKGGVEFAPTPLPLGAGSRLADAAFNASGRGMVLYQRRRSSTEHGLYLSEYANGQWRVAEELAFLHQQNQAGSIALNDDGNGVVVWAERIDASSSRVVARRIDGYELAPPETIAEGAALTLSTPFEAAVDELGNIAVGWAENTRARLRLWRAGAAAWLPVEDRISFSQSSAVVYLALAARGGKVVFGVSRASAQTIVYDEQDPEPYSVLGTHANFGPMDAALDGAGNALVVVAASSSVGLLYWNATDDVWQPATSADADTGYGNYCSPSIAAGATIHGAYVQACSGTAGQIATVKAWVKPVTVQGDVVSLDDRVFESVLGATATNNRLNDGGFELIRDADGVIHSFRWHTTDRTWLHRSSEAWNAADEVVFQAPPSELMTEFTSAWSNGPFGLYRSLETASGFFHTLR